MGKIMGIEAYLNVEEDKDLAEVAELTPESYRGLANDLAISKAEQSIIDEVAGVDGVDATDREEQEELEEERAMKTLFEQLYEIDPETKEVMVKGSAYDLKKWDEDMVCFTFGDPERIIALESAISPGERYLNKRFDNLVTKHTALKQLITKHSNQLRAKTISKSFAQDFKEVMGYGLPNIHMESFTTAPSSTNYSIAMEEMTNQQIAIAAGAGVAGIAIVYKLIQWFARALNKNTLANSSISENFKAYSERKEMLKNLPMDMVKVKANIDSSLDELKKSVGENPAINIKDALDKLKKATAGDDPEVVFDEATLAYLEIELAGKITPFIERLTTGHLDNNWWKYLGDTIVEAKKAQNSILARIDSADNQFSGDKSSDNGQPGGTYSWVSETIIKLNLPGFSNNGASISGTIRPDLRNWEAVSSWFSGQTSNIFTPYTDDRKFNLRYLTSQALRNIDISIFDQLDSGHVQEMSKIAEKLKQHADEASKKGKEASKTNKVEKNDRAQNIVSLSKEFQFVSSILRFAIQIRNQLGLLSVKLTSAGGKSESWIKRLLK